MKVPANKKMVENTPFIWEGDQAGFLKSLVQVENGASINAANGGFVMLLGPRVENNSSSLIPPSAKSHVGHNAFEKRP